MKKSNNAPSVPIIPAVKSEATVETAAPVNPRKGKTKPGTPEVTPAHKVYMPMTAEKMKVMSGADLLTRYEIVRDIKIACLDGLHVDGVSKHEKYLLRADMKTLDAERFALTRLLKKGKKTKSGWLMGRKGNRCGIVDYTPLR